MKTGRHVLNVLFALFAGLAPVQWAAADEICSFAFVQQDGSLKISGYLVRLYGIYVPPTDQTCFTFIRPAPCVTKASLPMDFKNFGRFRSLDTSGDVSSGQHHAQLQGRQLKT